MKANNSGKLIQHLKQLANDPKWQANGLTPCEKYKMRIGDRVAAKGVAVANFPFEKVVAFFNLPDYMPRINQDILKYNILERDPQDGSEIIHMEMKTPWPVWNRDFVVACARRREGNVFYVTMQSVDYPLEEFQGVVRGFLYVGGYIVQMIDNNRTKITFLGNADPKGNIPDLVVNILSSNQGEVAAKIAPTMVKAGF